MFNTWKEGAEGRGHQAEISPVNSLTPLRWILQKPCLSILLLHHLVGVSVLLLLIWLVPSSVPLKQLSVLLVLWRMQLYSSSPDNSKLITNRKNYNLRHPQTALTILRKHNSSFCHHFVLYFWKSFTQQFVFIWGGWNKNGIWDISLRILK